MSTTSNGIEVETLQERAIRAAQEQEELSKRRAQEYEESKQRQRLESFGWRLRNNLGISEYDGVLDTDGTAFDTIVTADDITLKYTQSGTRPSEGYVSMCIPCVECGKDDAWITVDDLSSVGRVLNGERWGDGLCGECWLAREERTGVSAKEIEAAEERHGFAPSPTATPTPEPSAAERLGLALVDLLAEQGYTIFPGPEEY